MKVGTFGSVSADVQPAFLLTRPSSIQRVFHCSSVGTCLHECMYCAWITQHLTAACLRCCTQYLKRWSSKLTYLFLAFGKRVPMLSSLSICLICHQVRQDNAADMSLHAAWPATSPGTAEIQPQLLEPYCTLLQTCSWWLASLMSEWPLKTSATW